MQNRGRVHLDAVREGTRHTLLGAWLFLHAEAFR
jgi:hypothetical protein